MPKALPTSYAMTSGSKSRRIAAIVFGTVFLLGLGVIGWQEYYPSSPMFEAIGMSGPRANSGRRCWRSVVMTRFGPWRSRDVACSGVNFFGGGERRAEIVGVDLLTRQIKGAKRAWSVLDSADWQRERDSIPRALARLGGRQIMCPQPAAANLTWLVKSSYWKFPSFYVRMTAYDFATFPGPAMSRWQLQLDGYPDAPYECEHDLFDPQRNDCHSGDMTQLHLPGGWMVCFRNPLGD
jgi:hypothetical protein